MLIRASQVTNKLRKYSRLLNMTDANTGKATEEAQTDAAARRSGGEFVRGLSRFRSFIGDEEFRAEPNRYHLFVALNCPWCHRVTLARNILGLEKSISLDVAFPSRTNDDDPVAPGLWEFSPGRIASSTKAPLEECTNETVTGQNFRLVCQIYEAEGTLYTYIHIHSYIHTFIHSYRYIHKYAYTHIA